MDKVSGNREPLLFNGNIFIVCNMLIFVIASAAEPGSATLFMNGKETKII